MYVYKRKSLTSRNQIKDQSRPLRTLERYTYPGYYRFAGDFSVQGIAQSDLQLGAEPDIVRIFLIDPTGILGDKDTLRKEFVSKLEDKFNNLDPGWLAKQNLKFMVEYRGREPTVKEKAAFNRLDFPVYLLDKQHGHKTILQLMKEHEIPKKIGKTDIYKLAEDGWKLDHTRGVGIPSGPGFRKIGFMKTHKIMEQSTADIWRGLVNATAHEIGHMGNRMQHSKTGLMKYPVPLNVDIDFSTDDKYLFLSNLVRLRKVTTASARPSIRSRWVGLGWFVDRRMGQQATPDGHETLTTQAASGVVQNQPDLIALREGVRRPDLADPSDHIAKGEERRHVLRRPKQKVADALRESVTHLFELHRLILASNQRDEQFRLIGEAMHLVQDSYSPAHVERDSKTRRIIHIRHYCAQPVLLLPPLMREHTCLIDSRDHIWIPGTAQTPQTFTAEAKEAITASREYLVMVLKHLSLPSPRPQEPILRDLDAFVARHLQLPALRPGARGPAVRDLQRRVNRWLIGKRQPPIKITGMFGRQTARSVGAFQKAVGLRADGVVGTPTWVKLPAP